MPLLTDQHSPEINSFAAAPFAESLLIRKNSFSTLSSALRHHSRPLLLLSFLCLQIILFVIARSSSLSLSFPPIRRQRQLPAAAVPVRSFFNDSEQCSSGRVYVYELPSFFNRELLEQCEDLNPWSSSCNAMTNEGFGPPATDVEGVVPVDLVPAWFRTDQFVSEIIFHNKILKHKCRTMEPRSAAAFYIPFYAGLAVGKYLWSNYSAVDRDHHCERMMQWVRGQEYYSRSNGWDHFLTMGRITWDFRRSKDSDWGSSCIYFPGMRNITRLLIERNSWDYFDVSVPYPTGFHPRSDADIIQWQEFVRTHPRTHLFCFAGAKRTSIKNDFRVLLLNQCKSAPASCLSLDCTATNCSNASSAILKTFLSSTFCLQPRGDSFTRRSIFDCMVAGSIPVLFWKRSAYSQYEWFLPKEAESYSVFIDRSKVKNGNVSIQSILEGYSEEDVGRMREKVIEYIPKFVYAAKEEGLESYKDAFEVAMEEVLKRFKEQQKWYKWS